MPRQINQTRGQFTSALYSDIVLPAATWYEKADLNSTDMHSFIHPLSEAVPPC